MEHAYECCPDCQDELRGRSVAWWAGRLKCHCAGCQRWQTPQVDVAGQVLGQARLGVRLVNLLGGLRTRLRLPLRPSQEVVQTLWAVDTEGRSWGWFVGWRGLTCTVHAWLARQKGSAGAT